MRATFWIILLVFAVVGLGAYPAITALAQAPTGSADQSYKLGAGDKLHIDVFGQPELSGNFVVDGSGSVQLPLVGQVKAAGLSSVEFEKEVAKAYQAGQYLKDPQVSVQVSDYRPFYIIGEVNKPGEYPYVNGMTVLNAVALAGGFTWRGDDSVVYIRRNGDTQERKYPADQTTNIRPGDVVRVGERYF